MHFLFLVKLIKPSLQLQTSYFIQTDTLTAACTVCLNLKVGSGTLHGANTFVFWTVCTVNIITEVEGDGLHTFRPVI